MGRVSGKIALITGAGSGVGKACMELFAKEGATVIGVGRTQASLDETLAAVRAGGGEGMVFAADLAKEDTAEQAVAAALAEYGRIDILVHAAAVGYNWEEKSPGTMGTIDAVAPDKWREVLRLNLDASYMVAKAVLPTMRKQRRGSILFVGSAAGEAGITEAHAYAVSKAGVHNLTRSLAVTYIKEGIRTNCLAPGPIDTPMSAALEPLFENPQTATLFTPMARPGTPLEMAYACLYLSSDEASYTNGAILMVDGGQSAML